MGLAEYSVLDARMRHLIIASAHLERLDNSSRWAEGPVYFPAGDYLLWSDIPNNRVLQWAEGMGVRVYSHDSGNCNGNTRDPLGRRIACQHLSRSVIRFEPDGSVAVLADAHDGKRLNSPNDVVVASDGAIWFTDPSYGIMSDYEGRRVPSEQPGCFVYRVDPLTGAVEAKITSLRLPNGLAFSPDESVLYVADSSRSHYDDGLHHVFAYPVRDRCEVGEGKSIGGNRGGCARRSADRSVRQSLGVLGARCRGIRARRRPARHHSRARDRIESHFRRPQEQPPLHYGDDIRLRSLYRRLRGPTPGGQFTKHS